MPVDTSGGRRLSAGKSSSGAVRVAVRCARDGRRPLLCGFDTSVLHDGLASRLTRSNRAATTRFVIPAHMIETMDERNLLVGRDGMRSGTTSALLVRVLHGYGLVWTLEINVQQRLLQVIVAEVLVTDAIK